MNWIHRFGWRYMVGFSFFFAGFLTVWLGHRALHWLLAGEPLWAWAGWLWAPLLVAALLALPFSLVEPEALAASMDAITWALGGSLLTAVAGALGIIGLWGIVGQAPDMAWLAAVGGCCLIGGNYLGLLLHRRMLYRVDLRRQRAELRRQIAELRELERVGRGGAFAAEAIVALMGGALIVSLVYAAAQAGGAL